MKDYTAITREAYDDIADEYSKRDTHVIDESSEVKALLDYFISVLPKGAKVLDIGCGGGRDSRYMFSKGISVIGIDASEKMIKNAHHADPNIEYVQMDFENLDFPKHTFDAVWANASLHHVPKETMEWVLKDIYKVLKPGGIFCSINKHGDSEGIRENEKFGRKVRRHFSFYKSAELKELSYAAGFKNIKTFTAGSGEWLNILARK